MYNIFVISEVACKRIGKATVFYDSVNNFITYISRKMEEHQWKKFIREKPKMFTRWTTAM